MAATPRRVAPEIVFDLLVFVVGAVVAVVATAVAYAQEASELDLAAVLAIGLILVMSHFPLVLTNRAGDVVIGFETCVLVFLVLTVPPIEALSLWCVGSVVTHGTQRKAWRSRIFNVGLTCLGGALLVGVFVAADPHGPAAELLAVMAGCAVYFLFDLVVTATSLAIEADEPISASLRWRSVPLGLACFVSIDTLGYLAARLHRSEPDWTLLLLLVPIGTILVAVRSVSRTHLAQQRLAGLLAAATEAPDWTSDAEIEEALLAKAEQTLRHTSAVVAETAPPPPALGVAIDVDGRPRRYLAVRREANGDHFEDEDVQALEALAAIGVAALNRRRLADEMAYLARHDVLTGLSNRAVFADRLSHALARNRSTRLVAVLYCDLDGFKGVNDLFGHEAGDRLLMSVAERLRGCLRPQDTAARLGGDEFGILLDDLVQEGDAEAVAERVLASLAPPFRLGGREFRVDASIGIAYAGRDAPSGEALLRSADTAMYRAKALGKGRAERFEPEMRSEDLRRLELEVELRRAVEADVVTVHLQPVVSLATGSIEAFEALARWTHPALGRISPDVFIPMAERLGLMRALGRHVLQRSHEAGRRLVAESGGPVTISVNLSPAQVSDPALAEAVARLRESDPDVQLVLEITEGTFIGDDAETVEALHVLKAAGAQLAVDDFGVGYSSIGYLHRLPLDILKIDKSFVHQLEDPRAFSLVQGVVSLARSMELTVVVEGVETWADAIAVRELGCGLAQGFLFCSAVPLEEAVDLLRRGGVDVGPLQRTTRAVRVPRSR